MKRSVTCFFAIAAIGAVSAHAIAQDRPQPKGPPKTMGDQGQLPPTNTMRNATPDMTGPDAGHPATGGASSGTGGSASPKGPPKRMGDEPGKLPATGTMSRSVPEMRGPNPEQK